MCFYPYIVDIDEYLSSYCHANTNCDNTIESYICASVPGNYGDCFNFTTTHIFYLLMEVYLDIIVEKKYEKGIFICRYLLFPCAKKFYSFRFRIY